MKRQSFCTAGAVTAAVAAFVSVCAPSAARAVPLPAELTYIRSDSQTTARGSDTIGVVGTIVATGTTPLPLRTLLQIDPTSIPAGSTISDVNLRTYIERLSDTHNPIHVEIYGLTRPFDEATATWQRASTAQAWTTLGGDYSPTLLASGTVTDPGGAGVDDTEIPLTETAAFTTLVQNAINAGTPISLLMKASTADESLLVRNVLFVASDDASPAGIRPVLDVTVVPEPSMSLAAAVAGGWMAARRRRRRQS